MKLIKLIKSVIVGILLLSFSIAAFAMSGPRPPYYGDEFYQDYDHNILDDAMVDRIKTVMRSFHLPRTVGNDLISEKCATGESCYMHQPISYKAARKELMGRLFLSKSTQDTWQVYDVYCGQERSESEFEQKNMGPGIIPDVKVLNVEHTWPQSKFNRSFRKETQKSDLHHLFPADSLLNSIRGSNPFGEVEHDKRILKCSQARYGLGEIEPEDIFEPPQSHKGNVARAMFYFSLRYDLAIDDREESVLRKWNEEDPVDESERARNEAIFEIQKNRNPFVDFPDLIERISGF